MSKPINWKDWLFLIPFGVLFAGNIESSTAEQVGANAFTVIVWGCFFWSLSPFVKMAIRKMKGKSMAWSYQIRDSKDQLMKSEGGYASQEAAIAAGRKQAGTLKDAGVFVGDGIATILGVQDSELPSR